MSEQTTQQGGAVMPGLRRLGPLDYLGSLTDPLALLQRTVRDLGDPFSVPTPDGLFVITGNPEAVRAVFSADPDTFEIPMRDKLAPFFGRSSLILTAGARHRQDRKLLNPPFNGARMRAYGKAIVEIAERAAQKLVPGEAFTMMDVTQSITLEVILRAVFGVEDDARRERFREAVAEMMASMASPFVVMFEFSRRKFGGIGPWARFCRASDRLDALLYEEIAGRRESATSREDILSLMMSARYDDGSAMTDEELRDQLHLLLFAGHDTTSTGLAWAFYWFCRVPEAREKLLAELAGLDKDAEPEVIAGLPYLDAFCQEALRVHPVVAEVARLVKKPMELCGYTVAPGTTISLSILLLHAREDIYPEAGRFRPERFLERKVTPFELIPFGGGARRCIGAALAMYEMKLVLATLLRRYRFRLVKDAAVRHVRRGLTMAPKGGVKMILEGPRGT